MTWIVGIIIVLGIVFFLIMRSGGNLKFWKTVAKNPQMAMEVFVNNPEVFAIEGITHDAIDRSYYDVGPFYFSFMGKNLKIYAHHSRLKTKENELIQMLSHDYVLKPTSSIPKLQFKFDASHFFQSDTYHILVNGKKNKVLSFFVFQENIGDIPTDLFTHSPLAKIVKADLNHHNLGTLTINDLYYGLENKGLYNRTTLDEAVQKFGLDKVLNTLYQNCIMDGGLAPFSYFNDPVYNSLCTGDYSYILDQATHYRKRNKESVSLPRGVTYCIQYLARVLSFSVYLHYLLKSGDALNAANHSVSVYIDLEFTTKDNAKKNKPYTIAMKDIVSTAS